MLDSKELSVSCMCGAAKHSFTIPTSSLPLSTHLCSCDISRRISGSLLTSYVNITHSPEAPKPDLSALTPYKSSGILTRHFCSTCGTQMYLEYNHDGHFEAATGTLQVNNTDKLVDYKAHIWVGDTPDGGASQFVTHVNGKELGRFLQDSGKSKVIPLSWTSSSSSESLKNKIDRIHAHCHCKGVEFFISPPNEFSKDAESSYADLLVPYHSGSSDNPKNHSWWLPGHDRFLAGTCACISCCRSSGFDLTFWAFIPTANITQDSSSTKLFSRSPYWGTMKTYRSSADVTRTFCGRCGANVFWDGDGRGGLVDVAVGLLDAPSGARAEEILAWWPRRVSFEEFALNRGLVQGLADGLKNWAKRNEGVEYVAVGEFPVSVEA
ncbi:hypothetical protein K505DRAFT_321562 [Melanomma pulvis-pyrius CBS 109.77]|uniref:CENP-V/GFA domain-containing protein n=1 Tax=Melanomma pulvis-pyrius CBS 109.77 TaxID=1314802 RepID=A0A6A6XTD6_9PLEO|nr:hypothetical protein K505DRAFT_321562 [Melanomma pulvis-pyrius CBS 109.77]